MLNWCIKNQNSGGEKIKNELQCLGFGSFIIYMMKDASPF